MRLMRQLTIWFWRIWCKTSAVWLPYLYFMKYSASLEEVNPKWYLIRPTGPPVKGSSSHIWSFFFSIRPLWPPEVLCFAALYQSPQTHRHQPHHHLHQCPSRLWRMSLCVWTGTTAARPWSRSEPAALRRRPLNIKTRTTFSPDLLGGSVTSFRQDVTVQSGFKSEQQLVDWTGICSPR